MYKTIGKALYILIICMAAAVLLVGCEADPGHGNAAVNNSAKENYAGNVPENTHSNASANAADNTSESSSVNNASENAQTDNTAQNNAPSGEIPDNASQNAQTDNTAQNNAPSGGVPDNTSQNTADPEPDHTPKTDAAEFRASHNVLGRTERYTVYELPFERDGMTIYGQLYLPNDELEDYPLVIVSHGFEGSFRLNTYINESFANAGFAVYAFDFCGGSSFSLSGGSMMDMSVLTEIKDLEAVYDGLLATGLADRKNVFLMGESQGGMVSALFASKRPSDVAALVLFYPAFVIPDNARALYGTKENIPEYVYAFTMTVGRRYYLDTIDMDPYEEIVGYEGDVLLIHGDQDPVVPYRYSQKALEVYKNAELITLYGATHGFGGQYLVDACNASVDFINDHLTDRK